MPIDFTTTALFSQIKRRCTFPTAQNTILPQDVADFLTEEMHSVIVPHFMAEMEDYFVANYDQVIVSGVDTYFIPARAIGTKLKDIVLVDSRGVEYGMARLMPEDVKSTTPLDNYSTVGFVIGNDAVTLIPGGQSLQQYTLRFKIFRRPNNLVLESNAGRILAINTGTNEVTLSNAPSSWTTATIFDVIKGLSPFRSVGEDQIITGLSGFILTFASLPSGMSVGDWVAEQYFSPIPQIPYDVHPLLVQRGICKVLESFKDLEGMKASFAMYEDMLERFSELTRPRVDGSPKKLSARNGIMDSGVRSW